MGAGPLIAAVGLALMLRLNANVNYFTDLLPALLIFSIGLACTVAPLTATVLSDADESNAGIASGVNNAIARVAGLLAVAAVGAVISAQFNLALTERLDGRPLSPSAMTAVAQARVQTLARVDSAQAGPDVADAVQSASLNAFHVGIGISAGLVALGGVLGLAGIRTPAARFAVRTAPAVSLPDSPWTPPTRFRSWLWWLPPARRSTRLERLEADMIDRTEVTMTPLDETVDHVRGSSTGRLILEYGDYECPYSRQAYRQIQRVESALGEKVRFAFRHFPLTEIHPHALAASAAAEAAALQGRFWEMHELLFHHQRALEDQDLQEYAGELGLDLTVFEGDRLGPVVLERIGRDVESGNASGEVRGTPTLFIDGVVYRGTYDTAVLLETLAP